MRTLFGRKFKDKIIIFSLFLSLSLKMFFEQEEVVNHSGTIQIQR